MEDKQGFSASGGAATTADHDTSHEVVRQTIVESLEAPMLQGITVAHCVAFRRNREIYERKVAEKNSESGIQVQETTYLNSVPSHMLKMMILGRFISAKHPSEVTNEQVKRCIELRAKIHLNEYNINLIEHRIQHIKLESRCKGSTLEDMVWDLVSKYTETLDKCGYDEFIEKKPSVAVEHIMQRLTHRELCSRALTVLRFRKSEGIRDDFQMFFEALINTAKQLDIEEVTKARHQQSTAEAEVDAILEGTLQSRGEGSRNNRKNRWKRSKGGRNETKNSDSKANDSSQRDKKRNLPPCLNPKCGGNHYISDCPNSTSEEKAKLKKEYHKAKRAKRGKTSNGKPQGQVGQVARAQGSDNSSMFAASFCCGAVEVIVLADQGADANIVSPSVLDDIRRADPTLCIKPLPEPLTYRNASPTAPHITCSRQMQADIMIRIRHGTNLMLRGIKWLISDAEVDKVFIGRHVLSAVGLNYRTLLSAACDRFEGLVDVPQALRNDNAEDGPCANTGSNIAIHSILQDREFQEGSTYHRHGGYEYDALDDSDVYVDLGDETPEELETALNKMLLEAKTQGISETGQRRLEKLLQEYKSVFEHGWVNPNQPTCHQ